MLRPAGCCTSPESCARCSPQVIAPSQGLDSHPQFWLPAESGHPAPVTAASLLLLPLPQLLLQLLHSCSRACGQGRCCCCCCHCRACLLRQQGAQHNQQCRFNDECPDEDAGWWRCGCKHVTHTVRMCIPVHLVNYNHCAHRAPGSTVPNTLYATPCCCCVLVML